MFEAIAFLITIASFPSIVSFSTPKRSFTKLTANLLLCLVTLYVVPLLRFIVTLTVLSSNLFALIVFIELLFESTFISLSRLASAISIVIVFLSADNTSL